MGAYISTSPPSEVVSTLEGIHGVTESRRSIVVRDNVHKKNLLADVKTAIHEYGKKGIRITYRFDYTDEGEILVMTSSCINTPVSDPLDSALPSQTPSH